MRTGLVTDLLKKRKAWLQTSDNSFLFHDVLLLSCSPKAQYLRDDVLLLNSVNVVCVQ